MARISILDDGDKLPEKHVPDRLSDAALNNAFVGLGKAATGVAATDTANLQATLAASVSQRQRLPKGVYVIDASLTIPSGADVDFGGATIQRAAGSVFDMLTNADSGGNSGITLTNVTIDGNKDADGRVAVNAADRFGGLVLTSVTDSFLANVTVKGTVNNENTAGVYFNGCSDIYAVNLNGWDNDVTAILLNVSSRIRIDGSLTRGNTGSGVSSINSPECSYRGIITQDNGSSGLSVNGPRCRVSNVLAYNNDYSGVNVGHDVQPTDDTQLANIIAYGNGYEGITISGSARVSVTNFEAHGNTRNNLRVFQSSTQCRLSNGTVRNSAGGHGLLIESGKGHKVTDLHAFENALVGVYVNSGASFVTFDNLTAMNNGQVASANTAGIILNGTTGCKVRGCDVYDDQATKTQESGVWVSGGSNHIITSNYVPVNKTYGIRETGTPTGLVKANNIVA